MGNETYESQWMARQAAWLIRCLSRLAIVTASKRSKATEPNATHTVLYAEVKGMSAARRPMWT